MATTKQHNYTPYETKVSFKVEEGDVTVKKVNGEFGKEKAWMFTAEMKKGDYVTLKEYNGDIMVKLAAPTDELIGVLVSDPEWEGVRPNADVTSASAPKRRATVRLFGDWVIEYPVEPNNTVINVGDSIKMTGTNVFGKSDTQNNTRVLQKVPALAGGHVKTLTGFWGKI